jgi:hypothetical protein
MESLLACPQRHLQAIAGRSLPRVQPPPIDATIRSRGSVNKSAETDAAIHRQDAEHDIRSDAREGNRAVTCFHEIECLLGKRGERRIPTTEAHDQPDTKPLRCLVAIDERGDDETNCETAGHVDRERAPRKRRATAPIDEHVEAVAGDGSERPAHSHPEGDEHSGSFHK